MISRFPALICGTILFMAAFFIACSVEEYSDISVYDARLNAEVNPTGVDTEKPFFSWKLKSDNRNRFQCGQAGAGIHTDCRE